MVNEEKKHYVPTTEAITVETTAYALLTAVAHKDAEWADSAACWLTSQENYGGGFKSTQVRYTVLMEETSSPHR
jgi:hypothetical protein